MITARDFLDRFPEFASVPPTKIAAVIGESVPQVGASWVECDRRPAMLYLTAHLLASQGEPGRSAAIAAGTTYEGPMKRRKVGDVEVEFQNQNEITGTGNGGLDAAGYMSSVYGRQFLNYKRRNFPSIMAL